MKIGMNLFLWTDAPIFGEHGLILPKLKDIGYETIEFPIESISSTDVKAFSDLSDSLELDRSTVAVFDPNKYDPISKDKSLRYAAVEAIDEWSSKTRDIGADLLSGPFFQGLGRFSGCAPTIEEYDYARECLFEACSRAAKKGVRIALEPLNRFEMYFANTLADAKKFVVDLGLENVGVLGDTMHSNIEELNLAEAYCSALPELMHVHVSESTRGTPGSGHAVDKSFFDALKEGGYNGDLVIEAFSGRTTPSMIGALCLWRDHQDDAWQIAEKGYNFIKNSIS